MHHSKIEEHIDNRIIRHIVADGLKLSAVKSRLNDNVVKFKKRQECLNLTKYELLKNWKNITIKKKYTTFYVIHTKRRIKDIDWMISKRKKLNLSDEKLFKLVKFKEKIK